MKNEPFVTSWNHIYDWMNEAPGEFCIKDVDPSPISHSLLTRRFEHLVSAGVCERVGKRRGWYRLRNIEAEEMDFVNADDSSVDLWMPLRISDYVSFHPGNIIIIAGNPNSGKTSFAFNIIKENMRKDWDVHYFTSEMDAGELKMRLCKFPDIKIDQWNFKAYRRGGDFQDVIKPGTNSLNIIDFLEVHDEFYIIAKRLKEIHDRLEGGIAVVLLQKNPGSEVGLGGWRSMEVTRLALSLDYGWAKIVKAKNWVDPTKNPNGWSISFKLFDGCTIIPGPEGWKRQAKEGG